MEKTSALPYHAGHSNEIKSIYKIFTGLSQDQLEVCMKDWAELADEYRDLELRHKEYREVGCPAQLRKM